MQKSPQETKRNSKTKMIVFDEKTEKQLDHITKHLIQQQKIREPEVKPKTMRRRKQRLKKRLRKNMSMYLEKKLKRESCPSTTVRSEMTTKKLKDVLVKTLEKQSVKNNTEFKIPFKRCPKCEDKLSRCHCVS